MPTKKPVKYLRDVKRKGTRANQSHDQEGPVPARTRRRLMQMLGNQEAARLIETGELKINPLPPEVHAFLDQVRDNPGDYERLLLIVAFDPNPYQAFVDFLTGVYTETLQAIQDAPDPTAVVIEAVQELATIGQAYQAENPGFARRIQEESDLRQEIERAINQLGSDRLTPYMIDAYLVPDPSYLWGVGLDLAMNELSPELSRRAFESGVPQSLYATLGATLQSAAEQRYQGDEAFRQRVDEEQRRRQQQRRPRRSPPTVPPGLEESEERQA